MNRRGFLGTILGVAAVSKFKFKEAPAPKAFASSPAVFKTQDCDWGTFTFVPYRVTLVGPRGGKIASEVVYGMLQPDGLTINLDEVRFPEFKKSRIVSGCIVSPDNSPHKEWRLKFKDGPHVLGKKDTAHVKDIQIYLE
jgi:hypothetical protein